MKSILRRIRIINILIESTKT